MASGYKGGTSTSSNKSSSGSFSHNLLLIMAELLLAVLIFGLHAVSSVWWTGKRGGNVHILSFLAATGVTGPIIPIMFRLDPVIHKMGELTKDINIFLVIVCLVEYIMGAILIILDTIGTRYRSYYRDASICTAVLSLVLAVLLIIDLSFTLKKS